MLGVGLTASCLCLSDLAFAESSDSSPLKVAGQILGQVKNSRGVAQMGARVYLYNRYDELVGRVLTNDHGHFGFDALASDVYSVRVLLASFVPAERKNILVLPASENRLEINLASVLSTVQLQSAPATSGTVISDDWKWVLRASQATRPVLRYMPDLGSSSSNSTALFSQTTGVVKLSAGDGSSLARGSEQGLGTAFALATSLAGSSHLELSGNVAYSGNLATMPGAGLRTSYSRGDSSPQVVLTMRQLYLAPQMGSGIALGSANAPPLRTMSAAMVDQLELGGVKLDYGFDFQSVSYFDRLTYLSPFMRATVDLGEHGRLRAAASSGSKPSELMARDQRASNAEDRGSANGFEQHFSALAQAPSVSMTGSHVAVERSQSFEVSYEKVAGGRTYSLGAYREMVANAAFMLSGPAGFVPTQDLLPDLNSASSIFNAGSYSRLGYVAAIQQNLGDNAEVSIAAGRSGALSIFAPNESYADSRELRSLIRTVQRPWVTMRVSGKVPGSGTRVSVAYGWTDFNTLMPSHLFVTQTANQEVGWNLYIRQPVPTFSSVPWRVEAIADVRNALGQGYLKLGAADSRTLLTNSPRMLRGGLNFVF